MRKLYCVHFFISLICLVATKERDERGLVVDYKTLDGIHPDETQDDLRHRFVQGTRMLILHFIMDDHMKNISVMLFPLRISSVGLEKESSGVCNYEGEWMDGEHSLLMALSFCDGLNGILMDGRSSYEVEIVGNVSSGYLLLRSMNFLNGKRCDVTRKVLTDQEQLIHKIGKIREKRTVEITDSERDTGFTARTHPWKRYIEIIIVVDYVLFTQMKGDKRRITAKSVAVMNIVNSVLKPLEIIPVLVGIEFIEDERTLNISSEHKILLKNYSKMRRKLVMEEKNHDYTVFLSGINFDGNVVGYAYVGTMCDTNSSTAVVQHYPQTVSTGAIANIIVHEMGHSLGVLHDENFCKSREDAEESSVMAREGSEGFYWSNCSKIYIAKNIDRFQCLLNVPKIVSAFASCGNGRLDDEEQCDCGGSSCNNPCCNGFTCKLKPHAVCATGSCCNLQTCTPLPAGTMCRKSISECDLPEFCTGAVEFCPKDVHKYNSASCDGGKGSCYNGKCGSIRLICQSLTDPSTKEPEEEYEKEIKSQFQYNECEKILCQPHLKIDHSNEAKSLFNSLGFVAFSRTPVIQFTADNTNGIFCGINKVCVNKNCVAVHDLPYGGYCPSGCSGNGVCNSQGNCHCDRTYAPPTCSSLGFGGSIDSGHSFNPHDKSDNSKVLIWLILGIIPFVALLCCLWTEIKLRWDKGFSRQVAEGFPNASKCIDNVFCPCMTFLSRWLCSLGSDNKKSTSVISSEDRNIFSDFRRPTIVRVDMDVKPPESEFRSWGVASDTLFTDYITVTPKNSPKITKKVRLESDSSVWRCKSEETLSPKSKHIKFQHSISKDSGNSSELDDIPNQRLLSTSMSSLISTFIKFGKPQMSEEKSKEACHKKTQVTKKPDLRRLALDHLSRTAGQIDPAAKQPLQRSLSTDSSEKSSSPASSRPLLPPDAHQSEQHLHLIGDHGKLPPSNENVSAPLQSNLTPIQIPLLERSFSQPEPTSKLAPLLPPNRANVPRGSGK